MSQKRSIKADYLAQAPELKDFYRYPFPPMDWDKIIQTKQSQEIDRDRLADDLLAQNKDLENPGLMLENIERLRKPNTWTITTGHQLCLLGGPMYMLYKISTAIKMAAQLSDRYPEHQFVPVFWMASEDHDWEEINHFWADFDTKITYPGNFKGAVGRHRLESSISAIWPEQVPTRLADFYQPGKTLTDAFREFVHHLFGQYGLVILDGDRKTLKDSFAPLMKQELLDQRAYPPIIATSEALRDAGYKIQVSPREINLFYLKEGLRDRIVKTESGFALANAGQTWGEAELLKELSTHPERFSPNVVMRPLYQETILPNLAYIGGWGELSYWMQLRTMFEAFDCPFPLLLPRMTATLVDSETEAEWTALGFRKPDLGLPLHELNDAYIPQLFDEAPFQELVQQVLDRSRDLEAYMEGLDPTLARTVAGHNSQTEKKLGDLGKKVRKSIRNRNPKPFARIAALKDAIEPQGKKQERILNFSHFTSLPYPELIDFILKNCAPEAYEEAWLTLP